MERHVDGMAIIVVDALRFDFARDHLPKSVGSRLRTMHSSSQLFQFVADPPTVTMQRLKGLTTGGLPTFADISGSFGGASVDEDSWVQQLKDTPPDRRGYIQSVDSPFIPKMAFVGDDTWTDLYPTQFDDSHPFPSFNTRDLDTVDDGCLSHLPRQLGSLTSKHGNDTNPSNDSFELVVAHFLGVDHVGHTYGPHNRHMDEKLRQMDDMLSYVFDRIDSDKGSCRVAFVFGDHGMTEDGNHGGGTAEETNAALFAHFSPGCGDMGALADITGSEVGLQAEESFRSIHQIDLVPTISLLLGLPIPYANLGGLVPALIPSIAHEDKYSTAAKFSTALALNAAQVWHYLSTYSTTANELPAEPMSHLRTILQEAVSAYKEGIASPDGMSSLEYKKACGLFKLFLSEATDLGKQVWTRFDTDGMIIGISLLLLALILAFPSWSWLLRLMQSPILIAAGRAENYVTLLLMLFHCVALTFSNSYIINEPSITMFTLAVICIIMSSHRVVGQLNLGTDSHGASKRVSWHIFQNALQSGSLPIAIAACSRINALFVTGHGLDPSIRLHAAHHPAFFILSIAALILIRLALLCQHDSAGKFHVGGIKLMNGAIDATSLLCLAFSWWEKRSLDQNRNGYMLSRVAMIMSITGTIIHVIMRIARSGKEGKLTKANEDTFHQSISALFRCMIFTVAVTGPSSAASAVIYFAQVWSLCQVTMTERSGKVNATVSAALWRLAIRQAFFATGHACAFNRLQYSAAFVASDTFYFYPAGVSLFINTFGWDILGSISLLTLTNRSRKWQVWRWFVFYQMLETVSSCISVSIMRRHLMVWAIFAPRFVFAAIFMSLNLLCWLAQLVMRSR